MEMETERREPEWVTELGLQERLGHRFKNKELLQLALTHSSWANEHGGDGRHNQRLEFLGDAVLELCVSEELYRRYPDAREGPMTQMRSALVSEPSLARLARSLGIDQAILLGRGEERQGGRSKDSVLADAFEAVLAAAYEDGGLAAAQNVVRRVFAAEWPQMGPEPREQDPKSRLQELCQKLYKAGPVYALFDCSGPEHARIFAVKLELPDGREYRATESSCKKAEQTAAALALAEMKRG